MAIKVQWDADGPFAICDTTAEAVELLKQARIPGNGNGQASTGVASQTTDEKVAAIFAGINDKARKFLRALLVNPQGVEGNETLGKLCGTDPAGFGGTIGGISKESKKVGLAIEMLVKSEVRFDEARHRYRWWAPGRPRHAGRNRPGCRH